MGLLTHVPYQPPFWLPNGHWQTIYPSLFRRVAGIVYRRERLSTPDGDFLLLDWSETGGRQQEKSLVILSHGLEGDSHRPYVRGMVKELNSAGLNCLAWNYRSCGGELNLAPGFYHSGATDDLDLVVTHALNRGYGKIFLVGFSLGGNLTLKYLGEDRRRPPEIAKAICFSVPMQLEMCSLHLDKRVNRLYQKRFLNSLEQKVREKSIAYPEKIKARRLAEVRSVYGFDDVFTGPLHGFGGAHDYYSRCSASRFIASIEIKTRIINAANDPIVPADCLPAEEVSRLEQVDLWITQEGGHCGFLQRGGRYWSEQIAVQFLSEEA